MTSSRRAALIVEDQPFVGMVASDILRESGFETFHAFDAEAAAQVLSEHPEIDVVVTDAELNGAGDGLELAHRLSKERPGMQLVVTAAGKELSASDMPQGARSLRKPYASGDLRTIVSANPLFADA